MLKRKTEEIQELLDSLREAYGPHAIAHYGEWDDMRSTGFTIRDIPAIFSVLADAQLLEYHYNVQIESYPQDLQYVYHERAISRWDFLDLVRQMSGPRENWPMMKSRAKLNHSPLL